MRTLILSPLFLMPGLLCLADMAPTQPPTMLERLALVARIENPPAARPAVTPAAAASAAQSAHDPLGVDDVRAPEPEVRPAALPEAPVHPLIPRSLYLSHLMTEAGVIRPIGDFSPGTPLGIWQRQIDGREKRRGPAAVQTARSEFFRAVASEQSTASR
ncbi:MAG: hypothetical protein LBK99_01550 [Opitutaceae bacterium]|jgi:hypothetical protein|nr:hypothetical protein [Opitutaceae bacterium]